MPYLNISSYNRTSGSDSDFAINLSLSGLGDSGRTYSRVRLTSATVCAYWFNVTAENSTLTFQEQAGGPNLEATLGIGNYEADQLVSSLKTAMDAASALDGNGLVYTITISPTLNVMKIVGTGAFRILAPQNGRFNALNQITGWSLSSSTAFATTQYAPRVINTARYEQLHILSSLCDASSTVTSSGGQQAVLASIPANTIPFGVNYFYQPIQGGWRKLVGGNINGVNTLRFTLISDLGVIPDLNGGYITYQIEIE